MQNRKAIVVTGMHRSGTSALTRAISFFGYGLPQDLMKVQADNPKGHWEPQGIVRLNNSILAALKAAWDRPGPFLVPGLSTEESRQAVEKAVAQRYAGDSANAIRKSFGDADRIVLKDPRLTLLWPVWEKALSEAGYDARLVHIFRNPLEVADSLRTRNQLGIFRVMRLWLHYNLTALGNAETGKLAAVVDYEELLNEPENTLRRVMSAVGDPDGGDASATEQLTNYVSAADRHHKMTKAAVETMPTVATPVRDLYRLLCKWEQTPAADRSAAVADMNRQFGDIALLSGMMVGVNVSSLKPVTPARETASTAPDSGRRTFVLHYHLFKNAGTSLDAVLEWNFGKTWVEQEFVDTGPKGPKPALHSNRDAIGDFIASRPDLFALSSHTALLPVPTVENTDIFSIMFIRHPIDRLRSAYQFERRQNAETFGAKLAKETDLAGYLRTLLDHKSHRAAKNFQTFRLSLNEDENAGSEIERARRAVEQLSFIGLVETFSESLQVLEKRLRPMFPDFSAYEFRRNVTQEDVSSLDTRLETMRGEIGAGLYDELEAANADDLEIFAHVAKTYRFALAEQVA